MIEFLGCPLCGNERSVDPSEAYTICELCGMSLAEEAPRWVLVERNSMRTYCSPTCLKKHVVFSEGLPGDILTRM
jgi:ribosomal protein S27E